MAANWGREGAPKRRWDRPGRQPHVMWCEAALDATVSLAAGGGGGRRLVQPENQRDDRARDAPDEQPAQPGAAGDEVRAQAPAWSADDRRYLAGWLHTRIKRVGEKYRC